MYEYTREHTSGSFAAWMGGLPTERRETIAGHSVHMVHGSPLSLNDFWWQSLPEVAHRQRAAASGADIILATHSGLPWIRQVGNSLVVNVGVIGRPANDGQTTVCYALLDLSGPRASARIVPLAYDWEAQARSMRAAGLPEAFVHTNETGWWATCLEILPVWERALGRYQLYDSSVPGLCRNLGLAEPRPEVEPDLPVRPLLGSPLFPRRIWVHPTADHRTVAESEQRSPVLELVPLGARAAVPERVEHAAQLTLSSAGWHWHPDDVDDGLLLPDVHTPQHPVGSADITGAVRSVNRRLLEHLETTGALTRPRYCAG